jgi:transposase-like protein
VPADRGREHVLSDGLAPSRAAWEVRYPAIVRLWENAWAEFVPFLAFDPEIRTIICTTNAIESLNARLRRAVKARGHFPTEQAALKYLYLTVVSLDSTGRGRQRWSNRWKKALNAFDITYDGRLSASGGGWPRWRRPPSGSSRPTRRSAPSWPAGSARRRTTGPSN